jgi:hypothetical protein
VLRHTHARIDRTEAAIAMLQATKADDVDLKKVFHELREMLKEMNTGFLNLINRINASGERRNSAHRHGGGVAGVRPACGLVVVESRARPQSA